ncbi:MAG: hypothetical protein DRJ06_08605, partial [Candidatus Aminicenantes bacterium]
MFLETLLASLNGYSILAGSVKMNKESWSFWKMGMFNLNKAKEAQQRLSNLISLEYSGEPIK